MAIKQLKLITQRLPPLQIPENGKRVLQIDASDEFWGAISLEENLIELDASEGTRVVNLTPVKSITILPSKKS